MCVLGASHLTGMPLRSKLVMVDEWLDGHGVPVDTKKRVKNFFSQDAPSESKAVEVFQARMAWIHMAVVSGDGCRGCSSMDALPNGKAVGTHRKRGKLLGRTAERKSGWDALPNGKAVGMLQVVLTSTASLPAPQHPSLCDRYRTCTTKI